MAGSKSVGVVPHLRVTHSDVFCCVDEGSAFVQSAIRGVLLLNVALDLDRSRHARCLVDLDLHWHIIELKVLDDLPIVVFKVVSRWCL